MSLSDVTSMETQFGPAGAPSSELGRTPPQDIHAEQSVLGGMLLSKDMIADCVEVLRGVDFYRPAHELVYESVLDLYGRGEPADAVTVAAELTRRGELGRVGGATYLHTLISSVPTAANAGYYAEIVRERAVLRRLVEAGTRIVQLGYAANGDVDKIVDSAQAEIYGVSEKRNSEDYAPLRDVIEPTIEEIEAAEGRGAGMVGIPTGFADLDQLTNGLHPGQMIVLAARPAIGKSTLGLDVARACSIKAGLASVIFSLEMSRTEITMRLLSAESKVSLQNMRKGTMREEDWTRLARTMGRINDAPLFIDDSPNMSLMEIRSKCRRLKQRHDLKLVVVDYLQLMSSGKRVESRQQEVSEFSRALKLLAKELEVPVIAISQLNRGPEQRTDKKPAMSDLRESGCLTADSRILRADTGAETTMGELFQSGATDVPVWALDESLRYVRRHLTHVFSTGTKPVFRLTLASGKTLRATDNHPFMIHGGWVPLRELVPGTRVGVPQHVPAPESQVLWSDKQVRRAAADLWLDEEVFHLPKQQIAQFLRQVWRNHGSVSIDLGKRQGVVQVTVRRPVADSLSILLLRFGISSRIQRLPGLGNWFRLSVVESDSQRRFLQEVGVEGDSEVAGERLLDIVRITDTAIGVEELPIDVWEDVRGVLEQRDLTTADLAVALGPDYPGSVMWKTVPTRGRLAQIADILASEELDIVATNDLMWDEVVAIEADGVEEVYDATVVGMHNFIANGVAVHNSIEQDADMVILLHREDAYDRESPRAGEADFIVAKHRNGPTDTIVVAFQGQYSRFVDMPHSGG